MGGGAVAFLVKSTPPAALAPQLTQLQGVAEPCQLKDAAADTKTAQSR